MQQTVGVRTSAGAIGNQTLVVAVVPHHGPMVALDAAHGVAYSVRWTGNATQSDDARAFYRLNNASSVADAMKALEGDPTSPTAATTPATTPERRTSSSPTTRAQIGYDPHACVPSRPWATSPPSGRCRTSRFRAPGCWSGPTTSGRRSACPNDKLPRAAGSTKGFLATANSDPLGVSADNDPYSGNPGNVPYLSYGWDDGLGFRIARIQDVLSATIADAGTVSLDDVHALQTDHAMYLAKPFLAEISCRRRGALARPQRRRRRRRCSPGLEPRLPDRTRRERRPARPPPASPRSIRSRRRSTTEPDRVHDSQACLLFHTFLRKVIDATFSDEAAIAGVGVDSQSAIRGLAYLLSAEGQAGNPNNLLCSDVALNGSTLVTVANKTCRTQVLNALGFAYARLKNAYGPPTPFGEASNWVWGRVHTVTFTHPLYPLVDEGFNPGPFVRPGGASTVDVGNPAGGDPNNLSFAYGAGPNVRWAAVMDGTLANTTFQLPGLESGAAFTPNAPGMLGDWLTNTYFQWPFKPTDVTSVRTETFTRPEPRPIGLSRSGARRRPSAPSRSRSGARPAAAG